MWLRAGGTAEQALGSYGDRRANHNVMLRGTFDNARLRNLLVAETGNQTLGPDGEECSTFDAAMAYAAREVPVVILAGENYGTGSARDWAAKGTALLGVRAVVARSFERIHRTNLIALGVLPVVVGQDLPRIDPDTRISLHGIADLAEGRMELEVVIAFSEGGELAVIPGRADVMSDGQLAMLRAGGLFAMFRERFGAYPQVTLSA